MTAVAHTLPPSRGPPLPGRGPSPDPLHDRTWHRPDRRLRHRHVPADGSYGVNAIVSDARASFHVIPGVDRTKPTE